jgi:5'-nucleotidase/UDP-sugar diphosphatase
MKNGLKWGALLFGAAVSALSVVAIARSLPARSHPERVRDAAGTPTASKKTVQVQKDLNGTGSPERETNLGNLVADAVKDAGHADIALVPADEIVETQIPSGSVPITQITGALRYAEDSSDTVVTLDLTGAQILQALERAVSRAPKPFDGFLQVAGLQVRYDTGKPAGKRVTATGPNGGALSASRTYRIATTRPMANGGLGYFKIWDKSAIVADTGMSIASCVETYLSGLKAVESTVEGRIAKS